jgi:hypothetical protein
MIFIVELPNIPILTITNSSMFHSYVGAKVTGGGVDGPAAPQARTTDKKIPRLLKFLVKLSF